MDQQYAERDIINLDRQGNFYSLHVAAMTAEKLHNKSDIAAELAQRDYEKASAIGYLEALMKDMRQLQNYAEGQVCQHETTHRGGALWEICDECGAKWADDEGGKPDFEMPKELQRGQEALATVQQALDELR